MPKTEFTSDNDQTTDFNSATNDQTIGSFAQSYEFGAELPYFEMELADAPPDLEDRYQLREKLGEGTYGEVWKAFDRTIGRDIAMKRYKTTGSIGQKMCKVEVELTGALDHPGIPTIYDVDQNEDGESYFLMKYITGETLKSIIQRLRDGDRNLHKIYHYNKRVDIILQLLRTLSAVHAKGIIHRDIKPENIIIDPSGSAYLMDWGVALNLSVSDGADTLCGTPMYMSPEQAQRQSLDHRSDLYSLTAVFYEFISLQYYGPEPTQEELLAKITQHTVPDIDQIQNPLQGGFVPSEYKAFSIRGLKKNRDERFFAAEEMLVELQGIQNGDFCSICVRTTLKRRLYDYANLLDWNPYIVVPASVLVLASLFGLNLILGVLLAGWL
ncbi:MAG: serine/threonine-protein kinase [Myxococcota bacterium]|nr:serine/threonine-protein kinase [Myxococcota bacterium]